MKRVLISLLFLFLCGHAPTLIAQMPTLLPDQYEIEFSMPGVPQVRKDLHCYTAQELEALPKLLAGGGEKDGCKGTTKVTGPTMSSTTVCAVAGGMVATSGEMTFTSRESYRVVMLRYEGSQKDRGHPIITGKLLQVSRGRVAGRKSQAADAITHHANALTTCGPRNQTERKYNMNIKICNAGCP